MCAKNGEKSGKRQKKPILAHKKDESSEFYGKLTEHKGNREQSF